MKTQILFIQGGGAGTHDAWDNKLVDSLTRELGSGYDVRYPRMPNEAAPGYPAWKAAIMDEIAGLDDGAIVVGHSVGGTILINALAEVPPKQKLAGVFLIAAPFIGVGGWTGNDMTTANLSAGPMRRPSRTMCGLFCGWSTVVGLAPASG